MSKESTLQDAQWIRDLTEENLLAINDVMLDIQSELQLGESVSIPILPAVVKFHSLMPADSPKLRDRYGRLRWQASELLKAKGVLLAVEVEQGGHRWDSTLELRVHRDKFRQVLALIEQERERRTRAPEHKKDLQVTAPSEGIAKVEPAAPEKVTLGWLFKYVPVPLWIQFLGLMVSVFLAGVTLGRTSFVQELLGGSPFSSSEKGAFIESAMRYPYGTEFVVEDQHYQIAPGEKLLVPLQRSPASLRVWNCQGPARAQCSWVEFAVVKGAFYVRVFRERCG